MIEHITMALSHSLGLPGGTGSINDISERVRRYGKVEIFGNQLVSQIIDVNNVATIRRDTFSESTIPRVGNDQIRGGIEQNRLGSGLRERGIQRDKKFACL